MMLRSIRLLGFGGAALLATVLAGNGVAWAQDDEETEGAGDDEDPCEEGTPCGDAGEGDGEGDDNDAGYGEAGEEGVEGDDDGGEVDAEAGGEGGMSLPGGTIALMLSLQIGLGSEDVGGGAGKPISLAPDIWYGINDRLNAGVVTSIYGITGFWSGTRALNGGSGVCLTGEADPAEMELAGCPEVFDNVGAEVTYGILDGPSSFSVIDVGLQAAKFDPMLLSVKVGSRYAWRSGKLSFGMAPSVHIAVTERGEDVEVENHDLLFVPVDLGFRVTPQLTLGIQSGIAGPLQHFGDEYTVPVALGGVFMLNRNMMVIGAFSVDRVTGGEPEGTVEGPGAFDYRSLSFMVGYMM